MSEGLKGKWALILGASSGFGAESAVALARAGYDICGVHLDRKAGLAQACGSYHKFVLQEEVQNKPHPFRYFDRDGNVLEGVWYLRVTVHFVMRAVADIIVTARMDKKVHGATDCLQLGSVIV